VADEKSQNLQNHVRFVPAFHMFVLPVFGINVIRSIYSLIRNGVSFGTVFGVLMAVALLLLALYGRLFALTVQDRVIRLETRLRLAELLPADLKTRIAELTVAQLVSIRFASDAELPGLVRKVLDDKLNDRKAIKSLVKDWQGDYLRA